MGDIFSSIISTFRIGNSKTIIINYHTISLEIESDIICNNIIIVSARCLFIEKILLYSKVTFL